MPENLKPILPDIKSPADLKKLTNIQLIQLSNELRQFIIDELSCNPGHFGASLGVVELTVALHYVLNLPADQIIWDVGHQAYGHKILTGRKDVFHTNRKKDGISGYPNPNESEYDAFAVGHSSTSISAALGMAVADKLNNRTDRQIVAVIGDGSMTAGMAFEGLNNAGDLKTNMLVVLNDNHMAIDRSVGAFSEYLLDISTSRTYNKIKDDVWNFLGRVGKWGPNAQQAIQKIDNSIKSIVLRHSNLFEALNFRYFGPVDGHDVIYLARILEDMKKIPGPKLLHVLTVKGKGFKQAEEQQTVFHAPGLFDKSTGEIIKEVNNIETPPLYQDVFGETITELAKENKKIVGITPAMPSGCSLNIMMEEMPERVFDVGIAEQHAVTFSAGLAKQGMIPFCNIYSSFMQRSYDQAIHDVALQNLNVVFCLDRAGMVGADGATHQGAYDIAFMRCIPNVVISAPMNEIELRNLMYTAQLGKGPFVIRYPRGHGVITKWRKPFKEIQIGKGEILREGDEVAVLALGHPVNFALSATDKLEDEGIKAAVYNMRFVKPLDEELLHSIFKKFKYIVTVEDGSVSGGFGSAVLEFMAENNYSAKVKRLGIPDKFIEHATQMQQYKMCGYDSESIEKAVLEFHKLAEKKYHKAK
ncbi:MAG: 1-deoxy-D-xylulose-5-phosphate synthase [Bacteroidia bacterium]|nr:1-deoxy-D-xylulose-5-phosphate synthase [Bacteroidia bacterium]